MAGLLALRTEEMEKVKNFEHWGEPDFLLSFFLASAMGSILNYSIFLCTLYNSALTTTVVGCLKVCPVFFPGHGGFHDSRTHAAAAAERADQL